MESLKLDEMQLFFPNASQRATDLSESKKLLIHYTSAENAIKIISRKEIWLRNTAIMNDFEDVRHGVNLLTKAAQSETGNRLWRLMDQVRNGLGEQLKAFYSGLSDNIRHNTFITSLSEHPKCEDQLGRLSMWRAYGGAAGVGLILRLDPFFSKPLTFPAFISPVLYALDDDFNWHFTQFVDHIAANITAISDIEPDVVYLNMASAGRAAALSTKHKGFAEEQEWRVIADVHQVDGNFMRMCTEIVRGIPQRVIKIGLMNYGVDEIDISIPTLLERVIIGPTEHPQIIYDALRDAITAAGVADAGSRITASGIPLRT